MSPHRQNIYRCQTAQYLQILYASLFTGLPQCCIQRFLFSIRMPAGPGPGTINIVIDHQNFISCCIEDHGTGCYMGKSIVPGEDRIRKRTNIIQHHIPIRLFLKRSWNIVLKFFYIICHRSPSSPNTKTARHGDPVSGGLKSRHFIFWSVPAIFYE